MIQTIVRVLGTPREIALNNAGKTVIKSDNHDDVINNITSKYPDAVINIEPMFDEHSGVLFDLIYVQADFGTDSNEDQDDDDSGMGPVSPDDILNILRSRHNRHK